MPMQLQRFKHFADCVKRDQSVCALVESIELFRYHADSWYDENDEAVDDLVFSAELLNVHQCERTWRQPKSRPALIDILPYNAVARATFSAPPRKVSLGKVHEKVEEARKHAEALFDAAHDSLTGLLNQKGFRDTAAKLMVELHPQDSNAALGPGAEASSVAMFAMDIDLFKQVNDTYGHMYGDVVLQCLARRLMNLGGLLEADVDNPLKLCIARPSGEEFLLLITGLLNQTAINELGDRVRRMIADNPIPSDDEWAMLAPEMAKKNPPPPLSNRRLTISVGAASMAVPSKNRLEESIDTLRGQADRALYIAKSGGRNVVRHFSQILLCHGRVLEHHAETDLVAIDLGRNVDVALGQEFHVFHPAFDGETVFVRNDGRSSKVLGKYPRKAVGRIEVMDVQQEISFCKVAERICPSLFPAGSHLEAIPIGSISHLVSSSSFGGVVPGLELTPTDQLTKSVATSDEASPAPVLAVFAVDDVDTVVKQRGTAFINAALAELYGAVRESLPESSPIAQVQSTEFAAVAAIPTDDAETTARKIIQTASERCKGLATFSAGLFLDPPLTTNIMAADSSVLRREHALDYASYAAADAQSRCDSVATFTVQTALNIMRASHGKQHYRQAVQDCKAFRMMGIHNATVENLAAVCEFILPDRDEEFLLQAAGKTVEIDPSNQVFWRNLGVYRYWFGQPCEAHRAFSKANEVKPDSEPSSLLRCVMAMAMYHEFVAGGSIDAEELIESLRFASEQKLPAFNVTLTGIKAAMVDVKKRVESVAPTAVVSSAEPDVGEAFF